MTREKKKKGEKRQKKGEDLDAGEDTHKEMIEFCNYIAHLKIFKCHPLGDGYSG